MQMLRVELPTMTFGEFVKKRRGRLGLLQSDIGRAIDRPDSYISRLENNQFRDLPSPEEMRRLAKVLECTEADLLRAAGYITAPNEEQRSERMTVYTYIEQNEDLTDFQKRIIFEALEDAERRRREIEAAENGPGSGA